MTTFSCKTSQLITPEFIRLLANAQVRENKICAARRALSLCNKLKPGPTKAKHNSRILRALNSLRAAA